MDPGSDRLMFDSNRAGNVHLFTMDGSGGDIRQLTFGNGFEGYPSMSPDGSTIALDVGTATADLGVQLLDADGTNPRSVTDPLQGRPSTPSPHSRRTARGSPSSRPSMAHPARHARRSSSWTSMALACGS